MNMSLIGSIPKGEVAPWRAISEHQSSDPNKRGTGQRGQVSLLQPFPIHSSNPLWRLLEVLDKGKAAAVTTIVETRDKRTGKVIFENQSTVFIRGAGGFGGKRAGKGGSPIVYPRSRQLDINRLVI